jgi:hypothetical protein
LQPMNSGADALLRERGASPIESQSPSTAE